MVDLVYLLTSFVNRAEQQGDNDEMTKKKKRFGVWRRSYSSGRMAGSTAALVDFEALGIEAAAALQTLEQLAACRLYRRLVQLLAVQCAAFVFVFVVNDMQLALAFSMKI